MHFTVYSYVILFFYNVHSCQFSLKIKMLGSISLGMEQYRNILIILDAMQTVK